MTKRSVISAAFASTTVVFGVILFAGCSSLTGPKSSSRETAKSIDFVMQTLVKTAKEYFNQMAEATAARDRIDLLNTYEVITGGQKFAQLEARLTKNYFQGLRKLDVKKCPREFQVAYIEHVQALEQAQRDRTRAQGVMPFANLIFFIYTSGALSGKEVINDFHANDVATRKIQESWNRLERIAVKHGGGILE